MDIATFNIRFFPESEAQVEGAFEVMGELGVPLIAVEEITDRPRFVREARARLGSNWEVEFGPRDETGVARPMLNTGLLYDSSQYTVHAARLHPQPGHREGRPGQPVLEILLESRARAERLRVFVVHFKAGGEHAPTRKRQLAALTPIVRAAQQEAGEVVVLGDFNATGPVDRRNIQRFVDGTGLHWASEELGCTAYWEPDGHCQSSKLDHVLTSRAAEAAAHGPCASIGCDPGESCPIFFHEVSDHCPVSAHF